jgi:hypothetical protein
LAKFKISVRHKGCFQEEIREVEARSLVQARKICEEIKEENKKVVERCNDRNVYTTRAIEECSVIISSWRDEFWGCIGFDVQHKEPIKHV